MNLQNSDLSNIKSIYHFLKNIDTNEKMMLISMLSSKGTVSPKKSDFFECFGKLETKESADKLVSEIYNSRQFIEKEIAL